MLILKKKNNHYIIQNLWDLITPTSCPLLHINSFKDALSNEDVIYCQMGRHDFNNTEDIARNCYWYWIWSI